MPHTPGPWHVNNNFPWLVNGPPEAPGVIVDTKEHCDDEAEANARLIAAAPELLEACKMALLEDCYDFGASGAPEVIRAAIAKAQGEPHA